MTLFVITGASGSGKTAIAQDIQKGDWWTECISHTSRNKREGEKNGETYYFISEKQFLEFDKMGAFVEQVVYDGNYYGISKDEINRARDEHENVFIIADYHGYKQIKEQYPKSVGIFLYMSKEDCLANMLLRGDSFDNAVARISTYEEELGNRDKYDYVVKNVRDRQYCTENVLINIIKQYS